MRTFLYLLLVLTFANSISAVPSIQGKLDEYLDHINHNKTVDCSTTTIDVYGLIKMAAEYEFKEKAKQIESLYEQQLKNIKEETDNLRINFEGFKQEKSLTEVTKFRDSNNLDASQHLDLVTLGGRKYFFSKRQQFSWIDAMLYCRQFGMELASVETKEEDYLIIGQLIKSGIGGKVAVFTSGNQIGKATYSWLSGKPFTYTNWHPGNVNFRSGFHCMIYWEGKWTDNPCEGKLNAYRHFICEEV